MTDWFFIVHTPDPGVVHVHLVATNPDDGLDDELAVLAVELGMPDSWADPDRPGWRVTASPGVPHASLLQRVAVDADGVALCARCHSAVGEVLAHERQKLK